MEERRPDPLAKGLALAMAIVRSLLGAWIFGSPRGALGQLGFDDPRPETVALARLAGGRDLALGLHGLSAASDRDRLRESVAICAVVDAGDAIAFGSALSKREGIARTAAINAPLGAAAAALGAWALKRL